METGIHDWQIYFDIHELSTFCVSTYDMDHSPETFASYSWTLFHFDQWYRFNFISNLTGYFCDTKRNFQSCCRRCHQTVGILGVRNNTIVEVNVEASVIFSNPFVVLFAADLFLGTVQWWPTNTDMNAGVFMVRGLPHSYQHSIHMFDQCSCSSCTTVGRQSIKSPSIVLICKLNYGVGQDQLIFQACTQFFFQCLQKGFDLMVLQDKSMA